MKHLLLPLLAALALPTAALADSYWLVLRYTSSGHSLAGVAIDSIEMKSMEQCELMGAKWMGTKETKVEGRKQKGYGYVCLEGK
jgi:hypothetical protein